MRLVIESLPSGGFGFWKDGDLTVLRTCAAVQDAVRLAMLAPRTSAVPEWLRREVERGNRAGSVA